MRINVYTEELTAEAEIVTAEYTSSRTGLPMKNWGIRIFLKSSPALHHIPGRDDDRSAVTFWCGESEKNVCNFLDHIRDLAHAHTLTTWHDKVKAQQTAAEAAIGERK